jgi:hypothetical protein
MKPGDRVRPFRTYDPETKFIWNSLRDLIDETGTVVETFTGCEDDGTEWEGAVIDFDKTYTGIAVSVKCLRGVDNVPTEMDN